MKRLPLILLVAGAAMAATSCERTPDMVLKREPMARLMTDLTLADALSTEQSLGDFGPDSARLNLRRSVLAKHGVNEAVLDSSLRWYGAHLPRFMKVLDRADSMLADTLRALENSEKMAMILAAGDSVNLWPLAPSAILARSEGTEFLTFEIPADSTWERGDVFTLAFAFDNAVTTLSTTIAVDYRNRNRTTEAVTARQYPGDQRHFEVKLQLDSNISAARLYGYMQLKAAEGERAIVDSIRLVRTRLVSDNYNDLRRSTLSFKRNNE